MSRMPFHVLASLAMTTALLTSPARAQASQGVAEASYVARADDTFKRLCTKDYVVNPACDCLRRSARQQFTPKLYFGASTAMVSLYFASLYGPGNSDRLLSAKRAAEDELTRAHGFSKTDLRPMWRDLDAMRQRCDARQTW
ncbi:hypothetical protein [Parapedomonas caeni]